MKITEQEPEKQNRTEEKRPQPGRNAWDIRPYLAVGLTVVLVVLVCLAIFFFIFRFQGFADGIAQVIDSIQAVIIGFILAYLLNPVMRFFERIYTKKLFAKNGRLKNRRRLIRSLAVATAMAIFLTLIFVLVMLLVPQLVVSIQELVLTMGDKMDALISWVQRLVNNSELEGTDRKSGGGRICRAGNMAERTDPGQWHRPDDTAYDWSCQCGENDLQYHCGYDRCRVCADDKRALCGTG